MVIEPLREDNCFTLGFLYQIDSTGAVFAILLFVNKVFSFLFSQLSGENY